MVISDTVGFIRKLPHQLVEAFKATLEELEYADLLLHVIDVSNPQWQQQAAIVESLIRELKADHIPCLRVYNKCDLAFSGQRSAGGGHRVHLRQDWRGGAGAAGVHRQEAGQRVPAG